MPRKESPTNEDAAATPSPRARRKLPSLPKVKASRRKSDSSPSPTGSPLGRRSLTLTRTFSDSSLRSDSSSPTARRRTSHSSLHGPSSPSRKSSLRRSRSFSASPRSSRRESVTKLEEVPETRVKVAVRVRPKLPREKGEKIVCSVSENQIRLVNPKDGTSKSFKFDHSMWSVKKSDPDFVKQTDVFEMVGEGVLENTFAGINACVFAYGQTGSGKTHTMIGTDKPEDEGIIPRLCKGIFDRINENEDPHMKYKVEVSYMQIYNEKVQDLLGRSRKSLKVREHRLLGPYVQGLSKLAVKNQDAIATLMDNGNAARATAATGMNDQSSRSHAIVTIFVTQQFTDEASGHVGEKVSRLNLVDLAGSERLAKSGATGDRLVEGANINKSLTTLGLVISALAERDPSGSKAKFVPYRDSVLTFLLKDSLGGNCRTVMVATISPAAGSFDESMSTLRYADRAKRIVTHARVNEDPNARLIRELREEVERLRSQMADGVGANGQSEVHSAELIELRSALEETEGFIKELSTSWEEKLMETQRVLAEKEDLVEQLQAEKETLEEAKADNLLLRERLALMQQRMADESKRADDGRRRLLALEATLERSKSDDSGAHEVSATEREQAQRKSDVDTLIAMTGFNAEQCQKALEEAGYDLATAAASLMAELTRIETEKIALERHQSLQSC